tara:strand:+ start:1173 stop:1562 length:390 start_codon:yes stop_codon:yes gene_type:complete
MKIIGIGVDIVDNQRIKKSLKNNEFIKRIFTKNEINNSKKINNFNNYYAKRFASKEALMKSIGTGFAKNINFNDIEIVNNKLGKPSFKVSNKLKNLIKSRHNVKKYDIFLSISDEKKYSIAFVILTKIK